MGVEAFSTAAFSVATKALEKAGGVGETEALPPPFVVVDKPFKFVPFVLGMTGGVGEGEEIGVVRDDEVSDAARSCSLKYS